MLVNLYPLSLSPTHSPIFPRRASSTSAAPREIAASREAATWGSDVELEEMESEQTGLAFSLPPSPGRVCANSPVEFLHDFLFPSPGAHHTISFGLDDILHTAASDSEDFGPALADALPPSGQEARPSAAYSELVDVLSRATEKLALDWPDEPRESRASKLDERFLIGAHSKPERRKLPFFSDLHREISSSWKQPFSSHLTNAAAADFTNLVGSVEQGYTTMPVIEDTLTSHLSPSLAPSWKPRPLLPSKPCRTTSALIGKSYIAAGQTGMALHTMAILQAYQADVLKEMDEGTGLTPEAVKELRRATDLALRATKHTARAVGRSMAASEAAERHLLLNLTEIREKEKVFLMDAPISQSGLFGEAVSAVVDKFCSAKTQSAAFKQFMPRSYTLHFGKNPPRFDGVHLTVVNSASKASVLQQELSSLLQKGAIEEVLQSEVERGFFSRYFLVPKRDGGLRPILDLRRFNFSLYKGKFKMLTMRTIMSQVQEGDWFVTIDLKDAYFHIQVIQRHRRFLRFAFGGKAYQYKVLPFDLALAPRTFTKCMDAALAPLRLQGIRVLNYLDDWFILAHSRELVSRHRDIVLGHNHSLGLRMNAKKSVLLPSQ